MSAVPIHQTCGLGPRDQAFRFGSHALADDAGVRFCQRFTSGLPVHHVVADGEDFLVEISVAYLDGIGTDQFVAWLRATGRRG